ncbi:MAG: DUF932 domain-containing protein [Candidatus Dehalobacter alkaniphilus]
MKTGRTLQELAIELDRQQKAKRDLLIDTPALSFALDRDAGRIALNINKGQGPSGLVEIEQMGVNEIAHRQIGQHLGIPARYYDKMRSDFPELLATNVNGWFERTPATRMIRTLDGTARAFLSDKYRRIDNFEVAQTVLPIIRDMDGAAVESCELTDARMYLKVVNPRITAEVKKGDIVQAGLLITNSETGQGSVTVSPLIFRLVCTNGMIAADNSLRKYHVGRANEAGDNFDIYRDETIEADDRAFMMKIEDTVRAAVDQAKFEQIVGRMREATEAKMEVRAVPQVVELASKEFSLTQDEGNGILGHLIQGGDLSLYGLANAVTRHSQDVTSYDRATELEATGWRMMTMSPTLWRRLNEVNA